VFIITEYPQIVLLRICGLTNIIVQPSLPFAKARKMRAGSLVMHMERRLWSFTDGVRGRIAWAVAVGLASVAAGVARLALLGWLIADAGRGEPKRVWNDGSQAGTRTYLYLIPERRFTIALMTNLERASCEELVAPIVNIVLNKQ